jgi:hypothetical protein
MSQALDAAAEREVLVGRDEVCPKRERTYRIYLREIDTAGRIEDLEIIEFMTTSEVVPWDAFYAAAKVVSDAGDELEMDATLLQAKSAPRDVIGRILVRLYSEPYRASDPDSWREAIAAATDDLEMLDLEFFREEKRSR